MDHSLKQSKTYHLAHPLHSHPNNNHQNHSHLHSLPAYTKQKQFDVQRQENIFVKSSLVHLRRVDLNCEQSYRFVGIRELKSYQSRPEKKKRNLNSMNRKSLDSAWSISRVSSSKTVKPSFLTKEDLLKKLNSPKTTNQMAADQVLMQEKSSFLSSTLAQMEKTATSMKTKDGSGGLTKKECLKKGESQCLKKGVSLSKVKSIMRKYENEWEGLMMCRRKIQERRPMLKKYQSVLQNVVSFRESVEERQKNDLIEKSAHIKPEQWQLILRNNQSLRNIHRKQLIHAWAKGLRVVGASKSGKEVEWVQRKDREGCFFKELKRT